MLRLLQRLTQPRPDLQHHPAVTPAVKVRMPSLKNALIVLPCNSGHMKELQKHPPLFIVQKTRRQSANACDDLVTSVLCIPQSTSCGKHKKKLLLNLRAFRDAKDSTRGLLWGFDPLCRQVREGTGGETPTRPLHSFPGTFTSHPPYSVSKVRD
jgi:hypothetical protein